MRLKSVELQGFKSFPDRTVINFNRGMTVVVGPNGSGKSNIADAVRWVLGELSSKNIRGSKMEDVIFAGTDSRRPMGFAEVSLTIDNSGDGSRIDIDYDEVTITRRYYRDGNSDYLINRKPVRLKDISELFMNTGVGRDGYSIVGQGKAAEIISQKSDERRAVFEEAAGISKYRHKKNEAEKKLAETGENIIRLNDILAEIENRLKPLEKEAERAKQYLQIYEKKKNIDISLWMNEINTLRTSLETTDNKYKIAKHELELKDSEITAIERATEQLFNDSQDAKLRRERNESRTAEYQKRRFELDAQEKILNNDISNLREQNIRAEAELNVKSEALSSSKLNTKRLTEKLSGQKLTLDSLTATRKELAEKLETMQKSLDKAHGELELCRREIKRLEDEDVSNRVAAAAVKSAAKSAGEREQAIKDEINKAEKSAAILADRITAAKKSISEYSKKAATIKAETDKYSNELLEITKKTDDINKESEKVRLSLSSVRQRSETLRRMEEMFEGYPHSVRFIMSAVEEKRLSGIYGPISRIIDAPRRYAVAIETALGSNIQNIVTQNEQYAKAAISFLKANNAGRATFYPLTSIKGQPLSVGEDSLSSCRGYLGIASALVKYDEVFLEVISYMLGRTVVFDNLDNASEMARRFNYRVRAVTLDGQLINAGGSYTGGSVKRGAALLARSSEAEKLAAKETRLTIELKDFNAKLKTAKDSKDQVNAELKRLRSEADMIESLIRAEDTQCRVLEVQRDGDSGRIAVLSAELKSIADRQTSDTSELIALDNRQTEIAAKLNAEQKRHTMLDNETNSIKRLHGECSNEINAVMIKLTAQQKDVEASEDSLTVAVNAIDALSEQAEAIERGIYDRNSNIIQIENKIEQSRLDREALDDDITTLGKESIELLKKNREYEQKSEEFRVQNRNITKLRDNIFREYTRLESSRENMSSELDKAAIKLWDEYELTYNGAAATGYSPAAEDDKTRLTAQQNEYRMKIKALGPVNTGAMDEYRETKSRFDFLNNQLTDLIASRESLDTVIYKLENEMRIRFTKVMEDINYHFGEVFRELFGGGRAELTLTSPDDVLTSGIEINVAPPGKIIKNLMLLSGGEQAFVAIALFFAILKVNPTPFCILDEIEAPLDEVNVLKFAEYAKKYSENTQFILITHRRGTMEFADMLYGVTMHERGISTVLSMNVSEAEKKLGVKL